MKKLPIVLPSDDVKKYSYYCPLSLFAIIVILYLVDYLFVFYKGSSIIGVTVHLNKLLNNYIFSFYGVMITLSSVIITVMITIMTIIANMTTSIEKHLIEKKKNLYEGYLSKKNLKEFLSTKKDAYAVSLWVVISMLTVLILALTGYIFTINSIILFLLLLYFLFIGVANFILASLFVMGLIRIVLLSED